MQQAVTSLLRQGMYQAWHIEDQLGQPIDLSAKLGMLQGGRQIAAGDTINPAAHCLAGKETGQVAGYGARRPQIVGFGQQPCIAQVQLAITVQCCPPACRHVGNGLGRAGQGAL